MGLLVRNIENEYCEYRFWPWLSWKGKLRDKHSILFVLSDSDEEKTVYNLNGFKMVAPLDQSTVVSRQRRN
jgi:hypothetical protein